MTVPLNLHWLAAMAFERMLYCLAEGTALAILMALVLRLVPKKNSQTRFAVWFATLLAVIMLPLFQVGNGFDIGQTPAAGAGSSHPLITISASWAEYIVLGWAAIAVLGLFRVAIGLWQVHRLRRGCVELGSQRLPVELQAVVAEFRKHRPVSILVSPSLDVPTAIGFLRPAILVPAWLAERDAAAELRHVLLHELAHLRRWDDWTNLAQKLVKAVLFFHPGVWWIERKLSLDREMACDDAVLAQTSSPRVYAECLARVAERSFLRRQIALAQAAVDRMKQLSLRVTRILAEDRPHSTRLWKPAVPMVMAAAGLCAISTSTTPKLVRLSDGSQRVAAAPAVPSDFRQPTIKSGAADAVFDSSIPVAANLAKFTPASMNARTSPREWQASLKSMAQHPLSLEPHKPAKPAVKQSRLVALARNTRPKAQPPGIQSQSPGIRDQAAQPPLVWTNDQGEGPASLMFSAAYSVPENDPDVASQSNSPRGDVVLLVITGQRITSAGSEAWTWQIRTWELRAVAPASHPTKQIPSKT